MNTLRRIIALHIVDTKAHEIWHFRFEVWSLFASPAQNAKSRIRIKSNLSWQKHFMKADPESHSSDVFLDAATVSQM